MTDREVYMLPKTYLDMNILNLTSGDLYTKEFKHDKYNFKFTNEKFSINNDTGVITVNADANDDFLKSQLGEVEKLIAKLFNKAGGKADTDL